MSSPKDYGAISITHSDSALSAEEAALKKELTSDRRQPRSAIGCLLISVIVLGILVYTLAMRPTPQQHVSSSHTKHASKGSGGHYYPSIPAGADTSKEALYYEDQLVDHFDKDNHQTWRHRYYRSKKYWGGPGSPIFVVMAGEGAVPCILYEFVEEGLGKEFYGYVLQVEHRFYGKSQPNNGKKGSATDEQMRKYLSPDQAMADFVQLIRMTQDELGCDRDRSSVYYCPVVTIGASYPGFLAAMMRVVHPDVVDMAWASSAPLPLYAQDVDQYAYFDYITKVAEETLPGCPEGVKSTLQSIDDMLHEDGHYKDVAQQVGICVETLPSYIDNVDTFRDVLSMVTATSFADGNMMNYPPSHDTVFYESCAAFVDDKKNKRTPLEKMAALFEIKQGDAGDPDENDDETATPPPSPKLDCYDLRLEVPDGPNATVSSSDWSGVGDGNTGRMWDFQTCKDLVVQAGMSKESMFLHRPWTLEWLTEHCQVRFGATPTPHRLVDQWGFNDLVGNGVTHIVFTNGLKDGWASASYLEDLSDTLVAINMPNGAHHSDLRNHWPNHDDTDDIKQGLHEVTSILSDWLEDLQNDPSLFEMKVPPSR